MSAPTFRRMVIRFRQGAGPTGQIVRFAAQIASALHVELVGTLASDPNLERIAGHPASREFRLDQRKWRSLETASVNGELTSMTRQFERRFVAMVQSVNVEGRFAVDDGPDETDLLLVCEPEDPLEQLCRSFRDDILSAIESTLPVMIVPRRIRRSSGPVLVIARASADPTKLLGQELADALGEPVVTLEGRAADTLASLLDRIEAISPRLVVMPREGADQTSEELCMLARSCQIPLLLAPAGKDVPTRGGA